MKALFLLLTAAALLVAAPAVSAVPVMNAGDLIWDAFNSVQGVDLKGKYKESPENGLIDQTLEVQIEDAPPNTELQIFIEGFLVGTMITDAFGDANFRIDKLGLVPEPDGRAPKPRVETGDRVRVTDGNRSISATFQPRP